MKEQFELPKPTQAQIKADIAEYINLRGGYARVINVAGIPIKGKPGVLRKNPEMGGMGDVIGCIAAFYFEIEVKPTAETKLDPDQEKTKYRVERAGGIYYQVTCLDDVIKILEKRRFRA